MDNEAYNAYQRQELAAQRNEDRANRGDIEIDAYACGLKSPRKPIKDEEDYHGNP
jgi:hypothetical protein